MIIKNNNTYFKDIKANDIFCFDGDYYIKTKNKSIANEEQHPNYSIALCIYSPQGGWLKEGEIEYFQDDVPVIPIKSKLILNYTED